MEPSPTDSNGSSNVVNVTKKRTGKQPGIGGMAVPYKAAKAAKSIPPAGQGQSPSRPYFPSSIAKRTRAQSTASAGQRLAAKMDASSKDQADEVPYNPGQLISEEQEEPIPGMITQLRFGKNLNSVALQFYCWFLGKSNNSVGTNSAKGKSLAPTKSKKANGQTDPMAEAKQQLDCQQDGNYNSDSEEYSSEPKSKVADTKSKVN